MIETEEDSGNLYADPGGADADEMIARAQLATRIGEIIKGHTWSQRQAVDVPHPSIQTIEDTARSVSRH